MTFILKRYRVEVDGIEDVLITAKSPGQARSKAWQMWECDIGPLPFMDFLRRSRVLRETPVGGHFGHAISVAGKLAFYVSFDGQYIQFVRPGCDVVLNAHPDDVMRPWLEFGGNGSVPF